MSEQHQRSDIPHLQDWANAMALSPAIIGKVTRRVRSMPRRSGRRKNAA